VLIDGADINIEEHGHELLGEPDGLVLVACLDALPAGLAGEDEKLGGAVADAFFLGLGVFAHDRSGLRVPVP
jgi:hypothetical protein